MRLIIETILPTLDLIVITSVSPILEGVVPQGQAVGKSDTAYEWQASPIPLRGYFVYLTT